ncbi:ATP-binding cassette domain-containing protein [Candidatus Soleaferrea massiliensis]|uniref:ATP-binding cassette domain-containing protein n=1 Tax=Candidatus Soleaferrea massiliensis TaxID=1470354 RepID=UPI00058F3329|nr:ATP-binding cassette domain-containing protein [Candidatus Soleaferrea massiliensis]
MELRVQNMDFSYGKNRVFDNFSVTFDAGINVLIGSNGSGKTTLMKMLAGVYAPSGGFLSFNGKKYSDYKDIRKHLSYLPQEFTAYQEMKVIDFLNFIAEIKLEKKAKDVADHVRSAIEMTNIEDFSHKKIKELSGGMKKRVGIAQAIVADSEIIITDEPTAALDPEQCEAFNNILKKISQDRIIITSTHIIQDIHSDCDMLYILSEGELKYAGGYNELQRELSKNIFKIEKSKLDSLDPDKIKILGDFDENGKEYIKFSARKFDEDHIGAWESCAYSSADIWRYYKS